MIVKDQTILITGGAGSIGEFLVSDLFQDAKIIVIDKDVDRLNALRSNYNGIETYSCDLTNGSEVAKVIQRIYNDHKISVLINNAGLIHSEPLINILNPTQRVHSFAAWDQTVKSNLYTTFYTSASVAEQMVVQKIKGLIINISSISAKGNIGQTAYSAAKAGIEAMTITWAKELGMFGIRVAAIAPGFFDTASTRSSLSEANLKKWSKAVALNRLGDLKELAASIRFIVENDYYNAETLQINGGLSI